MHHPLSILRVRAGSMPAGYCSAQRRWVPIKIHKHSSGKDRIVCVECFFPVLALKDSLSLTEERTHRDYMQTKYRKAHPQENTNGNVQVGKHL